MLSRSADLQKKGGQRAQSGVRQKGLRDSAVAGEWAAVEAGGAKRPAPRYEHAVALLRRTLYLVGGNCGELMASTAASCNLSPSRAFVLCTYYGKR